MTEDAPQAPPTAPVAPGDAGTEPTAADETSAKDKREIAKAEKELVARATFSDKAPAGDWVDPKDNDSKLHVVQPPSESPFNNDGFVGVDPTLQGPSDVRFVGPDTAE